MSTYLAMANCPEGVYEEQRAVSYDDGRYLVDHYGVPGSTHVTPQQAMSISAVWQAVNLISGDVAKLPLNLYQRADTEQAGTLNKTHPAYRVVAIKPNDYQTPFEFWRQMMAQALIFNHAYAKVVYDNANRPLSLQPLSPYTYPLVLVGDEVWGSGSTYLPVPGSRLVYVAQVAGSLQVFDSGEVIHISSANLDMVQQSDLINLARNSWALTIETEEFSRSFFRNGANAGGTLEFPLGMTKEAIDNVIEAFRRIHSGAQQAFKTVPLRDGVKFNQLSVNLSDAELNALRQQQVREIARWYNLPPHKLGDSSNASYNSLEQENKSYLDSTLSPWLKTITSQCHSRLLADKQQNGNYYFKHDTRDLVQADAESQANTLTKLVAGGLLSPDEGRSWLGLDRRPDGEGDQYYYSNNMQPVGEEPEPVEPAPMVPEEAPSEDAQEAAERMCAKCGSEPAKRLYCSDACRQAAYRLRKKENSDD